MDATIISLIRNLTLTPEQASQQIQAYTRQQLAERMALMQQSLPNPEIRIET